MMCVLCVCMCAMYKHLAVLMEQNGIQNFPLRPNNNPDNQISNISVSAMY